jgi:hypothetical protein
MTSDKFALRAGSLRDTLADARTEACELAEAGVGRRTRLAMDATADALNAACALLELALDEALRAEFTP